MKEILIFCSAPADIKYALTLREQQPQAHCRIFVLHLKDLALFLRTLHLPERTKVEFIPFPSKTIAVKRIWNNLDIRYYLDRMKKTHFSQTKNCRIYFFSPYMNWVLFSFLQVLKPNNQLVYVSYLPQAEPGPIRLSLVDRQMLFWTRWVTRADLVYRRYHLMLVPVWHAMNEVERINAPDYQQTAKKYAWRSPTLQPAGNNILFFPGCETLTKNLRQVTEEVIQRLKTAGAEIFVKPHPRLGCPAWLLAAGVKQIPKYVPAEFLDLSVFSGVVGCESTALAEAAVCSNIPCISLIDLLDYHNPASSDFYKEYVSKISDGKVVFAEGVERAVCLLSKGRD